MGTTDRTGDGGRDNDQLRRMLERIDDEGWDGPTATMLLNLIRETIARPVAINAGLRGTAASQAEATAWSAVWELLASSGVRSADEPWGVIWKVARHAVANEVIAARYGTTARRAWDIANGAGAPPVGPLVGLRILDWHPRGAVEDDAAAAIDLKASYRTAITALREVGWSAADALRIVALVVQLPYPGDDDRSGTGARGWRTMARALELPPWQARRLCVALLGTATWPGLLPRMVCDGPRVRYAPAMRAALRSTRHRSLRSPVLTAIRAAHLRVITVPVEDADGLDDLESTVLTALDPPLNLAKMPPSPTRARLTTLRRRYGARANSSTTCPSIPQN